MSSFPKSVLKAALFLSGLAGIAACQAAESVTVDLPVKAPVNLPARLAATPGQVTSPDGSGYTMFSILPEADGESLFVTVVFKEDGKSGPAVFWTNDETGQQTTLSPDLAEGVTGDNQRTIAIPAALAGAAGKLVITGEQTKLLRVRLDWMPASPVFVAADQPPVSFVAGDRFQAPADLTGVAQAGLPDTWFGTVLDAPLQDGVEEIQGNVGFAVPLNASVRQSLFRVKLLGLPLDQSVDVWINGQLAGSLRPVVPPLTDAGYLVTDQGAISYAGWRSGAIFLPPGLIKEGENTIQIESKTSGVFLREAALQLRTSSPAVSQVAAKNPNPEEMGTSSN